MTADNPAIVTSPAVREAQARQRAASKNRPPLQYYQQRALCRAQQSASVTDSRESASFGSCASSVDAINLGMSEKAILRSKNNWTATSSAALRTAGAVPLISMARYAKEMHGNFFGSGAMKSSLGTVAQSRCGTHDGSLSGYVRAY